MRSLSGKVISRSGSAGCEIAAGYRLPGRADRLNSSGRCPLPSFKVLRQPLESSQYAAHPYRRLLAGHGMRCSMSRKADCWDNAPMESFFGSMKTELDDASGYQTRQAARSGLFQFIEGFYNCSSQRTSRYVVEEKRFCWAASGNAGCLGWALARRARPRAAVLSRSARLKIQGPFSRGCVASISPRSTASRKVRGATPTMAAASPRLSQGSTPSAASQYTGIR